MKVKLFSDRDLKMIKKYRIYLPFLFSGLVILFSFSFFINQAKKIKSFMARNQKQEEENNFLRERIDQINSFTDRHIDEQIEVSLQALPRLKDPTLALSAIKAVILKNNCLIDELNFSFGKVAKESEEELAKQRAGKIETVNINAKVKGNVENILGLVKEVNEVRPLISLTNIDLDLAEFIPQASLSLSISFSPVVVKEVSKKTDVLPTAKEKKTYEIIAAFDQVGAGIEIKEGDMVPGDRERNPFE